MKKLVLYVLVYYYYFGNQSNFPIFSKWKSDVQKLKPPVHKLRINL